MSSAMISAERGSQPSAPTMNVTVYEGARKSHLQLVFHSLGAVLLSLSTNTANGSPAKTSSVRSQSTRLSNAQ